MCIRDRDTAAMVGCSIAAVSFSSIFYILFSGAAGLLVYAVQPVSYTHLDVYKRQLIHRAGMEDLAAAGKALVAQAFADFFCKRSQMCIRDRRSCSGR